MHNTARIMSFQQKQNRKLKNMVKGWQLGGHEWVLLKNIIKLFELYLRIKIVSKFEKKNMKRIQTINNVMKWFNADIMAGCEARVDWNQADKKEQFYKLFGFGGNQQSAAAWNEMEPIARVQPESKTMMTFWAFTQHIQSTKNYLYRRKDPTCLGWWCYLVTMYSSMTLRFDVMQQLIRPTYAWRQGI